MTDPINQFAAELLSFKTPAMEWLERAGPIAKRMNEESTRDGEDANNASSVNNGD